MKEYRSEVDAWAALEEIHETCAEYEAKAYLKEVSGEKKASEKISLEYLQKIIDILKKYNYIED